MVKADVGMAWDQVVSTEKKKRKKYIHLKDNQWNGIFLVLKIILVNLSV